MAGKGLVDFAWRGAPKVRVNGRPHEAAVSTVEESRYVDLTIDGKPNESVVDWPKSSD